MKKYIYNIKKIFSGQEGVLVVWQISTGYKSFIPRLGAPLTSISVNSTDARVVVRCQDNCIHNLNIATMVSTFIFTFKNYKIKKTTKFNM